MESMSFVCDYAKISALVLMYKIEHEANGFCTFKDVDEDSFVLYVYPWSELEPFTAEEVKTITDLVNPYIFDPEDLT